MTVRSGAVRQAGTGEIYRPSRRWAERRYTDLRWYETLDRGGHFAAFEQPATFVDQVRGFFRTVR